MENLKDFAKQGETQAEAAAELTLAPETVEIEVTTSSPIEVENETPTVPEVIEEIDTAPKAQVAKALPATPVGKSTTFRYAEPPANPLLLDPYDWDQCTITVR